MRVLKGMFKSESGQVLPIALVMLVLGAFLVIPVISLMTTNLNANRQVDQANLETYAADAGVENILWEVGKDPGLLPEEGETITENMEDQSINGMSTVSTTLTNEGNRIYRINSIATLPDGHNTEVEVFLNNIDFTNLLDGAIVAKNDIEIQNGEIYGDIIYNDEDPKINNLEGDYNLIEQETTNWPTWEDLSPVYLPDVQGHNYTGPNPWFIDSTTPQPPELGPTYLDGSLTIDNGNTAGLTLKLTGTVYIMGNLKFDTPTKPYILDLNDQTIFVYGTEATKDPSSNVYAIDFPSQSVTLKGSGCIIADGNIQFMPGISADPGQEDEFVLVMSLSGKTQMKPTGVFYGSLVGNALVDLANAELHWTDPYDHDLNFPNMQISHTDYDIDPGAVLSYTIK
jgi:hypothetical protein